MSFDLDERPRCIVCGAEGGNCGPMDGSDDRPRHVLFAEWGGTLPTPRRGDQTMAEATTGGTVATERIWEEREVPRSNRTRRVLMFAPGQIVPEAEATRLNVKADGTQGKVPRNADGSDATVPLPPRPAKKAAAKKRAAKKAAAKKAAPRKRA